MQAVKDIDASLAKGIKHLNGLVTLQQILDGDTAPADVVIAAMHAARRCFVRLAAPESGLSDATDASRKVRSWVLARYEEFLDALLHLMTTGPDAVQAVATRSILALIAVDGGLRSLVQGYGVKTTRMLLRHLMEEGTTISDEVWAILETEYLNSFIDFRYYMMRLLPGLLVVRGAGGKVVEPEASDDDSDDDDDNNKDDGNGDDDSDDESEDEKVALDDDAVRQQQAEAETVATLQADETKPYTPSASNAVELLKRIVLQNIQTDITTLPAMGTSTQSATSTDSSTKRKRAPAPNSTIVPKVPHLHRAAYQAAWLRVFKLDLTPALCNDILRCLATTVIPCIPNPLCLCDFVIDSYAAGGITGSLALVPLFELLVHHRLDYPDFFPALYNLLTPAVFMGKHRAQFCAVLHQCILSPMLPKYLVAAFAKRLCHIALVTPPSVSLFVLPCLMNLLKNHPTATALIHRTQPPKEDEQPFAPWVSDPAEAHAAGSSLYELQALMKHYTPSVSTLAGSFKQELGGPKLPVQSMTELTYDALFAAAAPAKFKTTVPLAYKRPRQTFDASDEFAAVWQLPSP